MGCCTSLLYELTGGSKNTVKGVLDIDPSLVSYRHRVGYCRSPGILAEMALTDAQ